MLYMKLLLLGLLFSHEIGQTPCPHDCQTPITVLYHPNSNNILSIPNNISIDIKD